MAIPLQQNTLVFQTKISAVPLSTKTADISSMECLNKLRTILSEYRKEHYRQEIPSRFSKEIINAVDKDKSGMIKGAEIEQLLKNIDAEHKMSQEEIHQVLIELGVSDPSKGIAVSKVRGILQNILKNPIN